MPKGRGICISCEKRWHIIEEPVCKKCGKPLPDADIEYCFDCSRNQKSFEQCAALLDYSLPWVKEMLMQVKYYNHRQYLDFPCFVLAKRYQAKVKSWNTQALIPVPVHPDRRKQRGFNQAEEIARRLEEQWEIPVDTDLLERTKKTAPQKELGSRQRLQNLQAAFQGRENKNGYECVTLVDDIYTTGSTIEACSRILRETGVKHVYAVVLALGRGL